MIAGLAGQVLDLQARLGEIERELLAWHRSNDIAKRLATIPGIGTVCATALAASVTDPHQFRSGRQFAAWLGLTPLQHSSGGKERLGRISKMGDKYLRRLLVVGMTSLIRRAKYKPEAVDPWLADLCRASRPVWSPSRSPTRRRGWSGRSWCAAAFIVCRQASRHPSDGTARRTQTQRLRGRCDVMANRSDRG